MQDYFFPSCHPPKTIDGSDIAWLSLRLVAFKKIDVVPYIKIRPVAVIKGGLTTIKAVEQSLHGQAGLTPGVVRWVAHPNMAALNVDELLQINGSTEMWAPKFFLPQ